MSAATKLLVVGASLGGLDAVPVVIRGLDAALDLAVVIVQHRSPDSNGQLARILAQRSGREVEEAMDAAPLARGAVLLALFAVQHDWFPLAGFESLGFAELSFFDKVMDRLYHTALPVICYAIHLFAFMTILTKNSLMENMSADYVKTALAKGVTWPRAVFGHALRNSLIPIATSFGNNISLILTGSLLIERVFGIPGMGLLFFEAITARDYPIVMGYIFVSATLMLVGNLLSDLCVAAVDPRVRFGE